MRPREESGSGVREDPQSAASEEELLANVKAKLGRELRTIVLSSCIYATFFGMLLAAFYGRCPVWASLLPLMAYFIGKMFVCGVRLFVRANEFYKEDLKDMLEAIFMILFNVMTLETVVR